MKIELSKAGIEAIAVRASELTVERLIQLGSIIPPAQPKQRLNKGEFAAELRMSRTTFTKVEKEYGLSPSTSDRCYARETVEDLKRWLQNSENGVRSAR